MYNIGNRRYTGSKAQLTDWIMSLVLKECSGKTFLDLFAGTGVVAETASKYFSHVYVNDFLPSNYAAYKAFFDKGKYDKDKLIKLADIYNSLNASNLKDNYFSINYGNKYFSKSNSLMVGHIRELIEKEKKHLTDKE